LLLSSRLRRIGEFAVISLALALVAAPPAGAALAGGYAADPADGVSMTPPLNGNEHFGSTIVNAGTLLLVGVPDANDGLGAVVFINPVNHETRQINAPLEPSHSGPTHFGASVAVIPDVGKCQPPDPTRGANCIPTPNDPLHTPDYLVGAPGADIKTWAAYTSTTAPRTG